MMNTLTSAQIFIVISVFIMVVLLFLLLRYRRDAKELRDDLSKNILDFNQLAEKFDQLNAVKTQFEQQAIKAQAVNDGIHIRLLERDEKLQFVTQELNEAQVRNEQLTSQAINLKERCGILSAQTESLQQQLEKTQTALFEKESDKQNLNQKLTALSQELATLRTVLTEKEKQFIAQQQTIEQSKQQLSVEFQNLANRILEEKTQSFSQSNQSALETLLKPFRDQIEGFQKRTNEIHAESVRGNTALEVEIKKLLNVGLAMSQEANNLTSALKGEKKTLGNWGEIQLERALQLAGLVENTHYSAQAHFRDEQGGHNYPDFVLNLPDEKHLIIDSKMSLNAYESAVNSSDESQAERFLREHISALKNHIDNLSRKDYSNLIGVCSPNFVLMFIAVEPAYIEALKMDANLFNYGYEKNVIMVSHTTLMPILRTVANLWRIERGNTEAREIADRAGEIYNQICIIAERLNKLGNSLSAVTAHYNNTVTALIGQQGLAAKVERFKSLSAKANKALTKIEPLDNHLDLARLSIINSSTPPNRD